MKLLNLANSEKSFSESPAGLNQRQREPKSFTSWTFRILFLPKAKIGKIPEQFPEPRSANLRRQVAQSVEQRTENPCVGGSIPPLSTPPHFESPFIYFEFVCRRFDGVYPPESVAPVQWNKKNLRLFFFPLPSHSTLI